MRLFLFFKSKKIDTIVWLEQSPLPELTKMRLKSGIKNGIQGKAKLLVNIIKIYNQKFL